MKRYLAVFLAALCALFIAADADVARAESAEEKAMARWTRKQEVRDDMGGQFTLWATPYTSEYINLLMETEAENNLWTSSELEDYKYNFLRSIQIDDYFAIHIEMENLGASAHMNPFNEMIYLWVGNQKMFPVDYDKRFNMPLQGKRDGLVFFPRYDEKTGKPIFNKDMSIRLVLVGGASPVMNGREIRITWDIKAETGALSGTAADRMEVDRLLRRVEKLTNEKNALESQLESKNREIEEIMGRISELQGRR